MKPKISAVECLKEGWECFKADFLAIIVANVVYILGIIGIAIVLQVVILFIGTEKFYPLIFLSFLTIPIFIGNILIVSLKSAKKSILSTKLMNLDYRSMVRITYSFFILTFIQMSTFPVSAGVIYLALYTNFVPYYAVITVSIVSFITSIYFLMRLFFSTFVILDDPNIPVVEAFKKSYRITKHHVGSNLRLHGLIALIVIPGWFLFIPGYIGLMVGMVAHARFYLKLIDLDSANKVTEQPHKAPVTPL